MTALPQPLGAAFTAVAPRLGAAMGAHSFEGVSMRCFPSGAGALLMMLALAACGGDPTGPGDLDPCGDGPVFTTLAMPLAEINHISPLGNLNPPHHTLPTAHTYWNVHVPGAKQVPVHAPTEIVVWRVDRVEYSNRPLDDFTIDFEVCSSVRGRFAHVTGLGEALASLVAGQGECQSYSTIEGDTRVCSFHVRHRVPGGAVVGYVGDAEYGSGLDFGLEDDRTAIARLNPERLPPGKHVCPVDYYEPSLRSQLAGKFGDGITVRTTPPLCGQAYFDLPGTARGAWFKVGGSGFHENYALALAADNAYPESLAFSIGLIGTSHDGFVLHFAGTTTGSVRRRFEGVTAGGGVFCYDELQTRRDMAGTPLSDLIVLLQLRADGRLQLEVRTADGCGAGPWTFSAAAVMLER